ncbi:hypothetical protein HUT18_31650 [Streptomyces sp. NA04227]|uniref:hypothetical protein n=1 Tax=Streptomyces sp. NA04227 TaxID=2742136 RepID=UPI00159077D8|nr:hypothetical protein [Streptomyces sp. NA04227]QKW10287.1 hypothetical protein HUT18_31650 [Streptomyces sp. NA04227]
MRFRSLALSVTAALALVAQAAPGSAVPSPTALADKAVGGAESPAAPAAPEAPDCKPVKAAVEHRTDNSASCLALDVKLDRLPKLGAQADLVVEVSTSADKADVDLDLQLPATLKWVEAPHGLEAKTKPSKRPVDRGGIRSAEGRQEVTGAEPLRLTGRIEAVGTGPVEIRATANTPSGAHSATDNNYFTVGKESSKPGIAVDKANEVAPTASPATRANLAWKHRPVAAGGAAEGPGKGEACVTGTWNYVEHTGYTRVGANAEVRVYDEDADGDELLASGVTGELGDYRLCFANKDDEGTGQDVKVRFATENPQWVIRSKTTKAAYEFTTATKKGLKNGATADFGDVQPAAAELMRGVQAFDTINSAWDFQAKGECWDTEDGTCRRAVVNWEPDSTSCCWYDLQEDAAYISAATPDLPVVVLHEFGHGLMDDVYENAFPNSPNCSPHSLHRASSPGCAWTEGWPTYYAATVLEDPTFRWETGATLDLENATWGTSFPGRVWEDGDTVEGRIAGSLIDLVDASRHEKDDTCSEDPMGPLWDTFVHHVSGTFEEFWQHRTADGHDVGTSALTCLYYNTVDYR